MNNYQNMSSGSGLLKSVYPKGKPAGPIAQLNKQMPMMKAIRQRRDMIKTR